MKDNNSTLKHFTIAEGEITSILDNLQSGVGVFEVTPDDRLVPLFTNKSFYSIISDYTPSDMKLFAEDALWNVLPTDKRFLKELIYKSLNDNNPVDTVYRAFCKDKSLRHIKLHAARIQNSNSDNPTFLATFTLVTDVIEREIQSANHLSFLDRLMHDIPCGLILMDEHTPHSLLYANDRAVTSFGYKNLAEVKSKPLASFVVPEDLTLITHILEKLEQGGDVKNYTHRVVKKDGTIFWSRCVISRTINAEGIPCFLFAFVDISDEIKTLDDLENEHARFKLLTRANDLVVFEYDISTDLLTLYVNTKSGSTGKTRKVFIEDFREKLNSTDTVHPDDRQKAARSICVGNAFPVEVRVQLTHDAPNDYRWYSIQSTTMFSNHHNTKVSGTFRNIEDYKSMQSENTALNNRFSMALQHIYVTMLEVDLVTKDAVRYDKNLETNHFRINSIKECFGKDIHPDDLDEVCNVFRYTKINDLLSGQVSEINHECRLLHNDGSFYWASILLKFAPWDNNTVLIFVRNIDASKNRDIENQRKLEIALASAEHANKAKTDFISQMSHDIRTPMNAILGMATLAKLNIDNTDKLLDYLDKMYYSADYLMTLLGNILDLSRIESEGSTLIENSFSFNTWLTTIRTIIESQATNKDLSFRVELHNTINNSFIGDEMKMNRIIMNILSNSIRYTEPGGSIYLGIRQLSRHKGRIPVEFVIRDSGIGISEDFIKIMYKPFEQEKDERVNASGGSGLGLSIVKQFTDIMGGTINVTSTKNYGTTFTIVIPLSADKAGELKDNSLVDGDTNTAGSAARILLADDNDINLEIATILLQQQNYIVECAKNGREAVDLFRKNPPDHFAALLIDIRMPIMDGLEATKLIRSSGVPGADSIPIIAMTACTLQSDIDKAYALGITDYLTKPINQQLMYQTLKKHIDSAYK